MTPDINEMLAKYRETASPFMRDQAKKFRAMSASDQRELLFYLFANMAVRMPLAAFSMKPKG